MPTNKDSMEIPVIKNLFKDKKKKIRTKYFKHRRIRSGYGRNI